MVSRFRDSLPQLGNELFLADGGLETTLVFHHGYELREFAAFDLLRTPEGEKAIRDVERPFLELAERYRAGVLLDASTWRASPDWGAKLGYDLPALAKANHRAIAMLHEMRDELRRRGRVRDVVVSGVVGPRGDGYVPSATMTASEAQKYHSWQIERFADEDLDMVAAYTINYVEEAIGIALAARKAHVPVAISFTLENDGRLPTGQTLKGAIEDVDAATLAYPAYYMVNCVHPLYFAPVLKENEPWVERVRGLRGNASTKSHAELNESTTLDVGDPADFGRRHAELVARLPKINVLGGCCGTDIRHVTELAKSVAARFGKHATEELATR